MTEAQYGLLTAAPLIAIFAIGLYKVRALGLAGTVAAVVASAAIAATLFFTQ